MNPIEQIKKNQMKCLKTIYNYTGYTEDLAKEIDYLAGFIIFEAVKADRELTKVFSP